MSKRRSWGLQGGLLVVCFLAVMGLIAGSAFAGHHYGHYKDHNKTPKCEKSKNMQIVGYNDVQGRETLQVTTIHDDATGKNWAFIGHHNRGAWQLIHYNPLTGMDEENGTTILDTTDPRHPTVVVHIPNYTQAGPPIPANMENRNSRSTSVVLNFMGGGKDILVRNSEGNGSWYFEVFDITDILKNGGTAYYKIGSLGATDVGDLLSAHKGYLSENGFYYGAANEQGFTSGAHLVVWNLGPVANMDPGDYSWTQELGTLTSGSFVGRAWVDGQKLTDPDPVNLTWHHPIVDEENSRVYGGYLSGGNSVSVNIDFHDGAPHPASGPDMRFPIAWQLDNQPPYSGTHTVAPVYYDQVPNFGEGALPRVYALVSDEGTGGSVRCSSGMRQRAYMFDITDADLFADPPGTGIPYSMETWQVPDVSEGVDYCTKGGRFGPHQFNETISSKINRFADKITYFAYFNAGVRVVDLTDPANLKEVGYCVPPANANTEYVTQGEFDTNLGVAIQSNDVDVDSRGLVNATDRVGSGFYVMQYTPEKKKKH